MDNTNTPKTKKNASVPDTEPEILPETMAPQLSSETPIKPKPRARIKPTVEGINSPKVSQETVVNNISNRPSLTEEEKELIAEPKFSKTSAPRLIPQNMAARASRPEHKVGRWIITGVVLLVIVASGYVAYIWNVERHVLPVPGYTNNSQNPSFQNSANTNPNSVPSQPETTPTSSTSSLPSTTPIIPPQSLTVNSTPTGFLNVRSLPSTSGKLITQVHPGETFAYVTTKNGWYEIVLPDDTTGWVIGTYVKAQ